MKLVETDTETPPEVPPPEQEGKPTPPRPEHRRVSVSLLFTLFVLVSTVVAVYVLVPERHNALLTAALEAHAEEDGFDLERPSAGELHAWSKGLFGRDVDWPEHGSEVEAIGARQTTVLNRAAALVRYRIAGAEITLLVQRPREALPRTYRRAKGDDLCVSWRHGRLTFTAVGPAGKKRWREILGVPE